MLLIFLFFFEKSFYMVTFYFNMQINYGVGYMNSIDSIVITEVNKVIKKELTKEKSWFSKTYNKAKIYGIITLGIGLSVISAGCSNLRIGAPPNDYELRLEDNQRSDKPTPIGIYLEYKF